MTDAWRWWIAGGIVLAACGGDRAGCGYASAQEAHFWLSDSASGSPGPEAPTFNLSLNETTTVYVWGRPTADQQVRGLSLNLVSDSSGVDFVDGGYTFFNEVDGSIDRFEFVRDSTSTPSLESEFPEVDVAGGDADELLGINGFTISSSATIRGFGPVCTDGETGCEVADDGEPAWLLAEIDIKAVTADATVDLYLQVGDRGVLERELAEGDYDLDGEVGASDHTAWAAAYGGFQPAADGTGDGVVNAADYTVWRDHHGDLAVLGLVSDTEVRFGVDAGAGVEPLHNAATDQEVNLFGDDPDATIAIAAVTALGVPEPGALASAIGACAALGAIRIRRLRPTR